MGLVLFVCGANVARSQVAEAYFNHFSKHNKAVSAGIKFEGHAEVSPTMKTLLTQDGVSTQGLKPKKLDHEMIKKADRIIVMCDDECPVHLTETGKVEFWDIEDPKDLRLDAKKNIVKKIKTRVLVLVKEMESR